MAFTKITGPGIHTLTNIVSHNVKSSGIITAVNGNLNGWLAVGSTASFSGNVSIGGTLTYDDVTNVESVGLITAKNGIFIPDDKKLEIGNEAGSGDLSLFYDSTPGESLITHTGPGVFKIEGNSSNNIFIRPKNGENSITAKPNAEVELYYDNQLRFRTSGVGATIRDSAASGSGISNSLDLLNIGNNSGDGSSISFLRSPGNTRAQIIAVKNETSNNETDLVFKTTKNGGTLTESLRILGNTQRVGIGTTIPNAPIHVQSSDNTLGILTSTDDGANLDLSDNDTMSRIRSVDGRLHLYADFGSNVSDSAIRFFVDGANEKVRFTNSGRVGIGTTNPTRNLQIGSLEVDSYNVIRLGRRIASSNTNLPLIGHHSGDGTGSGLALCATSNQGAIHFFTGNGGNGFGASNNEERVIIKHDGEVGIGTTNPENLLDVNQSFGRQRFNKYGHYIAKNNGASTTEYWTFAPRSSGNLGIGRGAPDIEGTVGVANDKLTIKSTGEVGIGSTHPTTKLDVVGDVKISGITTFASAITAPDVITAGALLHEGDTDTLVHFSANDTIELKTGSVSRFLVNNAGLNLTNGYLNSNGNRIILGDSSGATDDRIVFGNNNDCFMYHDSTNTFIENNTGILKILGDTIQIGEGADKVGIGTATIDKKLTVYGGVGIDGTHATQVTLDVDNRVGMANTAGSEQLILNLRGDVANNQQLVFKNYRLRNGSDWTTSTFRIQKVVDVTKMGYIDFGTGSGNAGRDMQFGNGSGTVYMHFDSSQGHVGIGTTAPRQKFEVIGTVASGRPTFQHESGYGGLQIAGPAMGSGASLFFTRGYASSGTGTTTFSLFMAGGDQSLNFVAGDASEYLTKTKMMIENTGFVGIGTRNPDEELHVYGTASDPSIFLENGATGTSDDTILKFGIGGTTANNYIYFGDADDSNVGQIRYNHDLDFMTFTTGASERVRIFGDGRMNIGGSSEVQLTTNSTAVLHLNGAIVGANVDGAFGARIIIDDDDTGTTSGGDRERGSILAQFNGNASGGDTSDECRLWNIHSDVNCTADYDNCYGLYSDVRTSHTSGTITAMRGAYGIVQTTSSGSISEMVGLYGIAQPTTGSSGTVNDLVGGKFRANMAAGNSTAKATDLFGVWSQIDNDNDVNQATSGTRTALFYGNYDKTTGLNDPQGIRIDTDVPNYFRGGLAVGQSSNTLPTGKLDVEGDVNVSSGEITVSTPEYLRVGHTNAAHNQTIADNDTVVVQFGSEYDDTKNGWTTGASNYYTIQKTGYFLVTTQAVITSNTATSLRDWALGVEMSTDNGGSWSLIQNAGGRGGGNNNTDTDTVTPVVTFILNFTAGTRIRVRAYANTDGGNWQVDEDLGDTAGGSDYGGANFDNQKGTRLHIMRLH